MTISIEQDIKKNPTQTTLMKYHMQLKQQKRFPFWGLLSIYINDQFSCGRIAQYGFFLLVHNRSFIKENTGKLFSVSVDTGCHLGAEKMNRNQTGKKKKLNPWN